MFAFRKAAKPLLTRTVCRITPSGAPTYGTHSSLLSSLSCKGRSLLASRSLSRALCQSAGIAFVLEPKDFWTPVEGHTAPSIVC